MFIDVKSFKELINIFHKNQYIQLDLNITKLLKDQKGSLGSALELYHSYNLTNSPTTDLKNYFWSKKEQLKGSERVDTYDLIQVIHALYHYNSPLDDYREPLYIRGEKSCELDSVELIDCLQYIDRIDRYVRIVREPYSKPRIEVL